jgi:oligopeptide/dipeptide ABC transporter ATP-binding protein
MTDLAQNAVQAAIADASGTLLDVRDLKIHFPAGSGVLARGNAVKAVDGVSFTIRRGETLGLVGESGCGKTTTGRGILQLLPITSGSVIFQGEDLAKLSPRAIRQKRAHMQMVFQDPFGSLDPRFTIGQVVAEPLINFNQGSRAEIRQRSEELLRLVGLNPAYINRYPHEFSGGQRQRIGIARSLALNPSLIIADEPVSALDVSVQAQVLNLMEDLQRKLGLTYLFISHNLSVVRHISDRVAVMYLGRIVEAADKKTLYTLPMHPYTEALLSAIPVPDPNEEEKRQRIVLTGDLPSPAAPPSGCHFHPRCPRAQLLGNPEICHTEAPPLEAKASGHLVACHFATERPEVKGDLI